MSRNRPILMLVLLFLAARGFLWPQPARAESASLLYGEANLLLGHSSEDGWIGEKGNLKNGLGVEFLSKLSGDTGDFLTLDLQARLTFDSAHTSDDDWVLELHDAWLEYKLGLGRNVRAGHFSPAFGLEPIVDTHGTLFQTLAGQNIGFKKDWGAAYRGTLGSYDVMVALQTGSGMGLAQQDGSFLASGRLSRAPSRELQFGLSLLSGEVLHSENMRTIPHPEFDDDAASRERVGTDIRYDTGALVLMAEISAGQNETNDVAGALVQAEHTLPSVQSLTLKGQARYWSNDIDTTDAATTTLGLGTAWQAMRPLTLRLGIFYDLQKPDEQQEDIQVFLQAYFWEKLR